MMLRRDVDAQTERRHEAVKEEALFQGTKKELGIILGQCNDLFEQHEKAMQKHKIHGRKGGRAEEAG